MPPGILLPARHSECIPDPTATPKPEAVDFRSYAFTNQIVVSFARLLTTTSRTTNRTSSSSHGWEVVILPSTLSPPPCPGQLFLKNTHRWRRFMARFHTSRHSGSRIVFTKCAKSRCRNLGWTDDSRPSRALILTNWKCFSAFENGRFIYCAGRP